MLEIGMKGVTKNFGFEDVLSGVDLEIMTGDRVAIVGRNGTGKSTILKIIAGMEPVGQGLVTLRKGATVGFLEQIPTLTGGSLPARDVLMAPFEQLWAMEQRMRDLEARMASETDADALDKLMRQYAHQQSAYEAVDGYAATERIARVVTGFGLTELLDRPFDVLSGGQKTIVMLAQTILRAPDILLLDEPTNHLDVRTLEWFEGYLAKYQGTVVIVSHDRYFLDKVAGKTVWLEKGRCHVYHGNYSFSQDKREQELLVEFEQYKNQQKKIDAMRAAIRRYRDWGARSDNEDMYRKAKQLEKRLERMEVLDKPQLEAARLPLTLSAGRIGREALRLEGLSLSIGGLSLLEETDLTLYYKQRVCLMGENGSGKTTLVRAILGELAPAGGGIYIAPGAKIGYVPQEIRFADERMSVLDAFRAECPCPQGEARSALAKFFFYGEDVFKRVGALSGGEKVLLKLAVLVRRQVDLLILDEPTNHIDLNTRELLEETLCDYPGTMLFISHDRYFIQKIADRILVLGDGRIESYEGDYEAYVKLKAQAG